VWVFVKILFFLRIHIHYFTISSWRKYFDWFTSISTSLRVIFIFFIHNVYFFLIITHLFTWDFFLHPTFWGLCYFEKLKNWICKFLVHFFFFPKINFHRAVCDWIGMFSFKSSHYSEINWKKKVLWSLYSW